jgi:hypothetical protein
MDHLKQVRVLDERTKMNYITTTKKILSSNCQISRVIHDKKKDKSRIVIIRSFNKYLSKKRSKFCY